jgi:hypothetical protein
MIREVGILDRGIHEPIESAHSFYIVMLVDSSTRDTTGYHHSLFRKTTEGQEPLRQIIPHFPLHPSLRRLLRKNDCVLSVCVIYRSLPMAGDAKKMSSSGRCDGWGSGVCPRPYLSFAGYSTQR